MSESPVVYVTRKIPQVGLDQLDAECELHVWDEDLPPSKAHIADRINELDADGLVCLLTDDIDATVLDASPSLDTVSTYSVGYDHIDLEAAAKRNISVGHTPGVLTETTADMTWALLTACARRVVEGHHYVDDDNWETWHPTLLTGQDLHDATLGIVGLGNIGTAVARRSTGFEMDIVYTARERKPEREAELVERGASVEYASLAEVCAQSDFVSLHVPLTDATRGLIAEPELRQMPEDAVLVNTSRGGVIDTDALVTALERDWIRRCGLDVTDPEPLPGTHSLLEYAPEKLIVTPHLGSASVQTREKMARMAAANALAGLFDNDFPYSALEDAGFA